MLLRSTGWENLNHACSEEPIRKRGEYEDTIRGMRYLMLSLNSIKTRTFVRK
jgi:hypothetical protein